MTETPASAALARRRENGDVARSTIADDIRKMQKEFQVAMPRGAEAEQLVRDALTALRQTRNLAKCDSQSVLGALMTCAQLGLRVGVLGQAWPLPFWDGKEKAYRAQLIIGYQGYSELAHRSPKVTSFMPRVVYENDEFDIDYGIQGTLVHKPARGTRGPAVGYHSIAKYSNGGYDFLFMSQEEMNKHRDDFATTRTKDGRIFGPWIDHPEPMGQKTTQRLLAKHIPKSPDLLVATYIDGGLRIDTSPNVAPEEATEQPAIGEDLFEGEIVDDGPPQPISPKMRTAVNARATELKLDREQKLKWISEILETEITTTSALTSEQGRRVLDAMDRFAAQQEGQ